MVTNRVDTIMERELTMEFARVTEAAALSSARWWGRGDKNAADDAAVKAMRKMFDTVNIDGTVVIGEGEMDEAPMLYIGEKVGTGRHAKVDVAVDPLEGTNLVAKGLTGAIAVLAVAPSGCLLHAPDMYMDKIAVGPEAKGVIDLEAPVAENLRAIAKAKGKDMDDLTVVVLDRPRHEKLIGKVRSLGARIRLITDGDISGALITATEGTGMDVLMGVGGSPEAVITACALKCIGGDMQCKFWPRNEEERKWALETGRAIDKVLSIDDLVASDNVFFAATGITDGELLKGVRYFGQGAKTYSLSMRSKSGTVRVIEATHRWDKLMQISQIRFD